MDGCFSVCRVARVLKMATQYVQEKIATDGAAHVEEHHRKAGGLAASMSPERRQQVEKTLKRKLDARCSLFVLIYIMNCKVPASSHRAILTFSRS